MDYYELLGIPRTASIEEITKAYRALAMKWHPDHNKQTEATQKFKEITNAFQTLTDYSKRADYNAKHPVAIPKKPKPKKHFKSMNEEERYEYILSHDPNFSKGTIFTPKPPKFDIWGNPVNQQQWARNNSYNFTYPKKTPPKKPIVKKDEFIDVFDRYYEKDMPSDLR